ncbi:MAG: hypothetical protein KF801_09480 [Cryobacterium sp.]|nr:hypothetical protein [Cryobacterium sp.]
MTNPDDAIILPSVPESPKRHAFPYLATIAPVVASLVIWLVTRSPFALVFALIGPVVALASVGDSVRRTRGERRRASVRFESELVAAIHAVGEAHSREREALEREAPRAAAIVADPVRNPERWRATLSAPLPVRVGTGNLPSGIRVERRDSAIASPRECSELDRLMESASEIDRAPITVDSRFGVGVVGPMPHVHALANSLVIQLANALSPAEFDLVHAAHPASGEGWHELLPHWSAPVERAVPTHADVDSSAKVGRSRTEFRPRAGGEGVVVATGSDEQDLPAECRIVVRLGGARARLARHPDVASSSSAETGRPVPRATQRDREGPRGREFAPDFLSDRQARAFAERLSDAARELVRCRRPELPHSVALSDLVQPAGEGRTTLSACIGIGSRGDVVVDLASDGPHAIVGGTTGSGKSELLLTWILAMAAAHGPNDVNFLLVDFKGGAAFDAVSTLPHTVGVVTDLDGPLANRAILSLKAELRRRERLLASVPARSIEELDGSVMLARLVIVVDEFATLAGALPELHDVFVDLAARGRSLGIHLILCTQRPAASIRETVMANCSLRMSLRVTNQADSIAVVGVSDAAKLPRHPIGRAILASGDDEPDVVQLARSVAGDAAAIARSPASSVTSVHRPWLDPLPGLVLPREVPDAAAPAISFGITDIPDEQRRGIAVYDPRAHGNVLVLGGSGPASRRHSRLSLDARETLSPFPPTSKAPGTRWNNALTVRGKSTRARSS